MTPVNKTKLVLVQPPENLPDKPSQDIQTNRKPIFENTEYVTTEGAARFLSKLLGKPFTANAIRLRVHRGQLEPVKPFGEQGESYFRISELRARFTRSQTKGRR